MTEIAAVILAAGLSRRMGRPKMALPWGDTTVIGQVVRVLAGAGSRPLVVVTGAAREIVEAVVAEAATLATLDTAPAIIFNPDFANGEMLVSLQAGIRALPESVEACLVALGDQPQIELPVVQAILAAYQETGGALLVPSFDMRRGHPWLIHRSQWPGLLGMPPGSTARDFLNRSPTAIRYVNVNRDSILQDLDTPEEYGKARHTAPGAAALPPASEGAEREIKTDTP